MSLRTLYECDGCKVTAVSPVGWFQVSLTKIEANDASTFLVHACVDCSKRSLVELADRVLASERTRRRATP